MARRSPYALVKIARLVQRLKGLLRSLIKEYIPAILSYRPSPSAEFKACASETSQRVVESHRTFGRCLTKLANGLPRRRLTVRQTGRHRSGPEIARCLNDLKIHTQHGDFSFPFLAAQDHLFLQHDLALIGITKSVNELENLGGLTDNPGAWAGPSSNTYPNYSWLHPTEAGVARRANSDPTTRGNTLPIGTLYAASVPLYPYISAPSNSPSELFPTSAVTWPYCQGINPVSSPVYAPSYLPWQTQSPFDPTEGLASIIPRRTGDSNIVQPYAQRIQTANPGIPQVAAGSGGSLGFGLGLHMSDMQNYPSPSSSTSGQTNSSYVSVLPPNVLSPSMPLLQSPSVAGSTGSRQSSRRFQEPPRNPEGLLYCTHAEHAQEQPPVFLRPCEWRKHMDKHERPYVCEEPECDKRGFTYSGGLLRHQREVHGQHGGPKATSMCPYSDCKRHVGSGFSRKENLAEHLRRVHRDAGADSTQKEDLESAQNTTCGTSGTGRKRRRVVRDDDSDAEEDLEQEVKKLKKQLQEKDERLEKLERQVELLIKGQK